MHEPVLFSACLEALITDPVGCYVDGTLGGGGHAAGILARLENGGRLLGFDRDTEAIERVERRLQPADGRRVELIRDNFANMAARLDERAVGQVDGVLLDLGVSSFQLDMPARGFSFRQDAPLDMRMDQTNGPTAAEWIDQASEKHMADVIRRYGEERAAHRIARAIAQARRRRPIQTTGELVDVVARVNGGRGGHRRHPATQTFQALRIALNDELESLERALESMTGRVRSGGRFVVMTFHSLEDRLVKRFFNRHVPRETALPGGGTQCEYDRPPVEWLWKKPLMADADEQRKNPRSRSAKLRAVAVGDG